jgi:phage shock protein PspC (stress-responsive transcriptional regulator)
MPNGVSRQGSCKCIFYSITEDMVEKMLTSVLCCSFAGTGLVSVVIAWFILPEVARRTPAEIDEL